MRKYLLAALAALSISLGVAHATLGRIDIPGAVFDPGGDVDDHLKFYARIRLAHVPVRVHGVCISACTYVLWLHRDQVCLTPGATFGFHLIRTGNTPEPDLTYAMNRQYMPREVNEWIAAWEAKNGKMSVQKIAYMPGSYLVERGVFPACED